MDVSVQVCLHLTLSCCLSICLSVSLNTVVKSFQCLRVSVRVTADSDGGGSGTREIVTPSMS